MEKVDTILKNLENIVKETMSVLHNLKQEREQLKDTISQLLNHLQFLSGRLPDNEQGRVNACILLASNALEHNNAVTLGPVDHVFLT